MKFSEEFIKKIKAVNVKGVKFEDWRDYGGDGSPVALSSMKQLMRDRFQEEVIARKLKPEEIMKNAQRGIELTHQTQTIVDEIKQKVFEIRGASNYNLSSSYYFKGSYFITEEQKKGFEKYVQGQIDELAKKDLISVSDFLKLVGCEGGWYSIPYGESRQITYHHSTPVIAYACLPLFNLGVFIIKTKRKYMSHKVWKADGHTFKVSRISEKEALETIAQLKEGRIKSDLKPSIKKQIEDKVILDQI